MADDPVNPIAVPQGGMKVSWGLGFVDCLIAFICMAGVILVPILKSAGSSTESENCQQNLRRIGRAILLYAEANGGALPTENWVDQLSSEEPDELVFACPHQRRIDPRTSGYAMNNGLVAKKLDSIGNAQSTPLVFDSRVTSISATAPPTDLARPGRHRNGRSNNILYADGSIGAVDAN